MKLIRTRGKGKKSGGRLVTFVVTLAAFFAVAVIEQTWARALPVSPGLTSQTGRSGQGAHPTDSPYTIRWLPDPSGANRISVEVTGLTDVMLERLRKANWKPANWQYLFRVQVEQDGLPQTQQPAMLGAYRVAGDAIRFEPQFPLEPGVTYRAVFRPFNLPPSGLHRAMPVTSIFRLEPRNTTPTTIVTQVYPTGDVLPENLLKFYIHFSAPMSRGRIYDHIRLLDGAGKAIELPFLEIDEELWDDQMTRLTVFIDPGRIKRGVLPLEDVGPALEEGKRYTLVVDRAWKDGAGNLLKETHQKSFQVGPADREPPDPTRWTIQPPAASTRNPLIIRFPEAMDHALAQRFIIVTDDSSKQVSGQIRLSDHERHWSFTPESPWSRGAYQVVIQTTIEDLAGNNIGKPFDVDLFEGVERRLTTATVKLPFQIR